MPEARPLVQPLTLLQIALAAGSAGLAGADWLLHAAPAQSWSWLVGFGTL